MTTTETPANRYLEGNFGPVHDEVTLTDLAVTGRIPEALDGRYLRNGPNPALAADPSKYHWFTGDGMVHGLRLRGGRAEWYRNRWVRASGVAAALGEAVRPGPVHAGMDLGPNTNVIGHAGRTFAIVEAGARPYELTDDLDTVGPCDFGGTLPNGYTAHPKLDPVTGELHAVCYWWGLGNQVQYVVIDRDARVTKVEHVPTHGSPMLHDMSLTESYAVVYDLPVAFDVEEAMAGVRFPYHWDPEYPARLGVLPRAGTAADVRWFDVDPCYVFHPLNSYEDGTALVLDVVRHPRMFDRERLGPNEGRPELWRWTLDLATGKAAEQLVDDHAQEFPRVDERLVGRRHRYGYAAGFPLTWTPSMPSSWLKHDLVAGTTAVRDFGVGKGTGEPVFVPSAPDAAEDDGWVLGLVYDADRDASDLWIVAAQDFTGDPVAVVHLPMRVPFGFHGNWIPTGQ